MSKRSSLKTRLVASISILVTLLIVTTCAVILNIGRNALDQVATASEKLAKDIDEHESDALDQLVEKQRAADMQFMEMKAHSLARQIASQAALPLAALNTGALDESIKQVYGDADVALCLILDKDGRPRTTSFNEKLPVIATALKRLNGSRDVMQLAAELEKDAEHIKPIEEPVLSAGDSRLLGKARVYLALGKLEQREDDLRASLGEVKKQNNAQFAAFESGIEAQKESKLANAMFQIALLAIIAILITVAVVVFVANSITRPIGMAVTAAEKVASGDLTAMIGAESNDETGQLLASIQQMTGSLNSLVSQVKHSSIQLVATATAIANNVRQQQATVNDFGSSTAEIAAAAKEITATSKELLATMNDVNGVAMETAGLADTGRANLSEMEKTIGQLGNATQSISSKLSAIREKADEINMVVTTVTKVADQTNLLSLNASIEAEKAGEYGLGFAVVAREIRRLADQTAVATLDIEEMVKEMQGAVSAGVMEMDRFAQDVRRGVEEVARIGLQQAKIIERVQTLTPRFKSVNEGMHAQSLGAEQISDAMVQLNDGARRTVMTLEEFNKAAENLHQAANGLKEEVSRFKVAS